jgi:hypothetical protein
MSTHQTPIFTHTWAQPLIEKRSKRLRSWRYFSRQSSLVSSSYQRIAHITDCNLLIRRSLCHPLCRHFTSPWEILAKEKLTKASVHPNSHLYVCYINCGTLLIYAGLIGECSLSCLLSILLSFTNTQSTHSSGTPKMFPSTSANLPTP